MAKKTKKEVKENRPAAPPVIKKSKWYSDKIQLSVVAGILMVTFIMYSPSLSSTKEFTNWDDTVYVLEQPIITQLDGAHLHALFTEPVSLNYHPITMLSLALNYNFSQLHPFGYFLTNIFLHLCNTFLVFIFLYLLSGRKFWIGAISALLFGIHPMHVESVAWISERKDLLYCFFFLGSCIGYLKYLERKQLKFLLLCFVLFVCSCLSKAMAAPLPVVLLLIDFYKQRKFNFRLFLEKAPFFAVSILLGVMAVRIQSQGAIGDIRIFSFLQRTMFASYGFMMYWAKFFAPVNLSALYPYPTVNDSGNLGWLFPVSLVVVLIFILVPGIILYKRDKSKFRLFVFGVGFFLAMTIMVLQFISVGIAIMADRYTYVSYIGILFLLTSLIQPYIENAKTKSLALGFVLIVSAIFAVAGYSRVKVWDNSGELWTDVIAKYPYTMVQNGNVITVTEVGADDAYKNRGNYYREHGNIEKAMADYETLVTVKSKDEDAYSGLANFYAMKGNYTRALELYSESLKLKPQKYDTYKNRSITYSSMGKHKEALDDLMTAVKYNPSLEPITLTSIAYEKLCLGKYDESIADCDKLIARNPNDADARFYRGTAYINTSKYQQGVDDLTIAAKVNPASGNVWYNLSVAYNKLGNKEQAYNAALKAKSNGYKVSDDYLKELGGGSVHN